MSSKYPFTAGQSSSSGSKSSASHSRTVSASGRNIAHEDRPSEEAEGSPSWLRSRLSPRKSREALQNHTASYPSPSSALGLKIKKKSKAPPLQPIPSPSFSSPTASPIPTYDSRGYPLKAAESGKSAEASRSSHRGRRGSDSSQSSFVSISTTGAGVADSGRLLTPDKPSWQSTSRDEDSPTTNSYPPIPAPMSYSLSNPSYDPYGYSSAYEPGPSPAASLYGDTRVSLDTVTSTMQFGKYDALSDPSRGDMSISSKGGSRGLADMFQLPADPASWSYNGPEDDDDLHDPYLKPRKRTRLLGSLFTARGASNIGCMALLIVALVTLFAGYPIISAYKDRHQTTLGAYNLGGINATGQVPSMGNFGLIDTDTPTSAYTHRSLETGETWDLVFSDEFNTAGRTFYPGDDPYWQAEDLHYWQTNNQEWYDPRTITTKDGALHITLDSYVTNNMDYTGGMMNTWNKFCFTGGYFEASVSLPGVSNIYGLWPAIWTLGNLGRAGYGGSLDGLWPYSYDSCDVGTLKNQTLDGWPEVALTQGDALYDLELSYLPGQRLSACTCDNDESHPGPRRANGSFVGRGAPEIDMFEALVTHDDLRQGQVSQSAQWAPFNPNYYFINNSKTYEIYDEEMTFLNTWQGGVWQEATSGVSITDQKCYTGNTSCFSIYGFEYAEGLDGYVTWVNNAKKAWTVRAGAMAANSEAFIGDRPVPDEPMYLIMNLGISTNFGAVDYEGLAPLFPTAMAVDYVRVYQDPNKRNLGCDPANRPTANYITRHPEIYTNPNITVMDQIPNFTKPKNRLIDTC